MPKIQWLDLPPQLRQHLFDRAKERQITMHDLFALEEWRCGCLTSIPATETTSSMAAFSTARAGLKTLQFFR